jgi:hypothetical protein
MTHSVRIVVTDGTTPIRSTFADDSYSSAHEVYAPVVVARLPSGLDLRWHADVVATLARRSGEIKAARLLNNWSELSPDLRTAILRTIREACISILDPRAYSFEFDRLIVRVSGGGGEEIRSRLRQQFLGSYIRDRVLWSSPAWRIKRMLYPEDPFGLADVYGVAKVTDDDDSLFEALRNKLQKASQYKAVWGQECCDIRRIVRPR